MCEFPTHPRVSVTEDLTLISGAFRSENGSVSVNSCEHQTKPHDMLISPFFSCVLKLDGPLANLPGDALPQRSTNTLVI